MIYSCVCHLNSVSSTYYVAAPPERMYCSQWRIFWKGGGRQFISSVLIYRKCEQRNICLLHKKMWSNRGAPHRPFESATDCSLILHVDIPFADLCVFFGHQQDFIVRGRKILRAPTKPRVPEKGISARRQNEGPIRATAAGPRRRSPEGPQKPIMLGRRGYRLHFFTGPMWAAPQWANT